MEHGEAVLKKGSSTCRDPFALVRGQSKSWKLGFSGCWWFTGSLLSMFGFGSTDLPGPNREYTIIP